LEKNRFKPVWFLDLARFDLVFFPIGSVFPVWIMFDFFGFRLIKSKSN
jgi:hypothetical protein